MIEPTTGRLLVLGPAVLVALLLSLALIVRLRPWLARLALARPNARSSHQAPTPQGGGIAVMAATLAVVSGAASSVIASMAALAAPAVVAGLLWHLAAGRR